MNVCSGIRALIPLAHICMLVRNVRFPKQGGLNFKLTTQHLSYIHSPYLRTSVGMDMENIMLKELNVYCCTEHVSLFNI
jgi:hypothetical protein